MEMNEIIGSILLILFCIILVVICLIITKEYPQDTVDIESIALRMAEEKEYEINIYDCSEFSENLAERYNQIGWNASTKVVIVNCSLDPWNNSESCSGHHQIVELNNVYVEATGGYIIHPDQYKAWGIYD